MNIISLMIRKETKKEIGKYLTDVSKLIFGGMVLASVIKIDNVSKFSVMLIGVLVTIVFGIAGFYFIDKNQ